MTQSPVNGFSLLKRTVSLFAMFALSFVYFPSMQIETAQADQFKAPTGPPALTTPSITKASDGAFESFAPLYPRSDEVYTVATNVSKPGGIEQLEDGVSMCLWLEEELDCQDTDPDPQTTFIIDWNWSADTERQDVVSVRGTNEYSADATRSDYDTDAAAADDTSALVEFVFQVSHAMRNSFQWNLLITADDGANTATVSRNKLRTSYFGSIETPRSNGVNYVVSENSSATVNDIAMGKYAANAYSEITLEATDFSRVINNSRVTLPIARSNVPSNLLSLSCSAASVYTGATPVPLDDDPQLFTTVGLMSGEGPDDIGKHSCRLTYKSNVTKANVSYQNTVTVGIGAGDYNAPSSISATDVTPDSATINWGEPTIVGTNGITLESYIVEISDDGGSSWSFAKEITDSTVRTYTANDLAERTSYDFRVSATTSVGAASLSTTAETDADAGASLQTLQALNSSLRNFSNTTSASTVVNAIETKNLQVFASPTYGSLAENMSSISGYSINQKGVFRRDLFSANTDLPKTGGFGNAIDDKPFIGFVGFANGEYLGSGLMALERFGNINRSTTVPVSSTTHLKDFFNRTGTTDFNYYRTYVLNANGTSVDGSNVLSGVNFSDNQRPNSSGYHSTIKFSADDGIWGFSRGETLDGDTPGPALSTYPSTSYGIQNYNAGDASQAYYWWGERVSSSNAVFYFFHGEPQ